MLITRPLKVPFFLRTSLDNDIDPIKILANLRKAAHKFLAWLTERETYRKVNR